MSGITPNYYPLFGPVDRDAALSQTLSNVWQWPGSCDTSHIVPFPVMLGLRPLVGMVWRLCFSQPNGRVLFRLVGCLNGPSGLTELAVIDSANKPPNIEVWNAPADVTAAVNAFFNANCNCMCNLGLQVKGDGTYPYTLFNARLEALWG